MTKNNIQKHPAALILFLSKGFVSVTAPKKTYLIYL